MLKIYGMLWLVVSIVMAALFVTGNLTLTVGLVFGFMIFGLVFMGMMGVLPAGVAHPPKRERVVKVKEISPVRDRGRVHGTHRSVHA